MGAIAYGILSILGLLGFIAAMCVVVYLFWRRPKPETPLPEGNYHIKCVGINKSTGAAVYDVTDLDDKSGEPTDKEDNALCQSMK